METVLESTGSSDEQMTIPFKTPATCDAESSPFSQSGSDVVGKETISSDVACKALTIVLEHSLLPDGMGCWSTTERRQKEELEVQIRKAKMLKKLNWSPNATMDIDSIANALRSIDMDKELASIPSVVCVHLFYFQLMINTK